MFFVVCSIHNMDIKCGKYQEETFLMWRSAVSSAWMNDVVYQIWWRATVMHVVKKGLSCSTWWLPDSLLAGTRSRVVMVTKWTATFSLPYGGQQMLNVRFWETSKSNRPGYSKSFNRI